MKWKKLLFPPLWLNVLLAVFCTAALVYVFVNELDESWMAYGVYALCFLSYVNKNDIDLSRIQELRCSRLCSYILLSVNLALSGAVLMMVSF